MDTIHLRPVKASNCTNTNNKSKSMSKQMRRYPQKHRQDFPICPCCGEILDLVAFLPKEHQMSVILSLPNYFINNDYICTQCQFLKNWRLPEDMKFIAKTFHESDDRQSIIDAMVSSGTIKILNNDIDLDLINTHKVFTINGMSYDEKSLLIEINGLKIIDSEDNKIMLFEIRQQSEINSNNMISTNTKIINLLIDLQILVLDKSGKCYECGLPTYFSPSPMNDNELDNFTDNYSDYLCSTCLFCKSNDLNPIDFGIESFEYDPVHDCVFDIVDWLCRDFITVQKSKKINTLIVKFNNIESLFEISEIDYPMSLINLLNKLKIADIIKLEFSEDDHENLNDEFDSQTDICLYDTDICLNDSDDSDNSEDVKLFDDEWLLDSRF